MSLHRCDAKMDLQDEIAILQAVYSKEHHHRLEVSISSEMDVWTCEFGIEAWAARLSSGTGKTPLEAFNAAYRDLIKFGDV